MLISNSIYSSQTISNSNRNEVSEDYRNNDNEINQLLESPPSLKNNIKLREAVAKAATSNKEQEIADALINEIDRAAENLSILQGWTEGGAAMFDSALYVILDDLKSKYQTTNDNFLLEDLFQIAIIDLISKGIVTDSTMLNKMQHFLESTGSGSHGVHESWDGNKFSQEFLSVYEFVEKHARDGSIAKAVIDFMNSCNTKGKLPQHFRDNFNNDTGYLFGSGFNKNSSISPMLRLTIMSEFLKRTPDLSQKELEFLITCNVSQLEKFIQEKIDPQMTLRELLTTNTSWNVIEFSGQKPFIDFTGVGINIDYFFDLYGNFPSRVLNDEDIKEINRIGDNVKMIMQTLKYWFQILRDERVAIARNI
ncbi:TPA: molecular chaperone [Vibrio cholerae]